MNTTQKAFLIAGIVFLCGGLGLLGARLLPGFNLTSGSEQEAFTQLREADEYLRQNSIDSARRASVIFNRVRARDVSPRINHLAEYGLAVALEKMGDRAAALSTYRKLRDEGVDDSELSEKVDYSLGKLFLYINHEEEGRSLLEALLARTRDEHLKSRIHTAYGVFYMKKGDRQRAEENFRVALKYNPENLQAEQLRAAAVQGQGRDWAAYEYYDDYLVGNANLEPHERQHLMGELRSEAYNSGIRSYRAGKYTEAVEFFRRVLLERVDGELNEKALSWTAESLAGAGNEAA
ncbi:MAG: hypothetical protein KDK34_16780, partial [Leptospiraceae bacterium]|nr:hypothetical protein [Leptospiraceae bacterium]